MKKIVTVLLLLLIGYSSGVAQATFATDRGSLSLGGGISLGSSGSDAFEDGEGNRRFNFSFSPYFSIFVVPSLAIGADLDFSVTSQGDYSNNTIGIGPEVVYYIAGHNDQTLYPYIGLSYQFSAYSYNYSDSDISGDSRNTVSTFKAGLMVMLSDAVALNTQFSYRSYVFDLGDSPESGNSIYLGIGIKAFIF